jgi:hypothetical protein
VRLNALQEYQTQLIERVKEDIKALQESFKTQYPQSEACYMSTQRDLPPVSGAIIWARQIKRQLATHLQRVEVFIASSLSFIFFFKSPSVLSFLSSLESWIECGRTCSASNGNRTRRAGSSRRRESASRRSSTRTPSSRRRALKYQYSLDLSIVH